MVRLALAEKDLPFELELEKVWERRPEFLSLDPAGEVPVLVEPDGEAITGAPTICEYIEDVYKTPPLIGTAPLARAEVRRLVSWFIYKFEREVTRHIHGEKFEKRFFAAGEPNGEAVRAGMVNIHVHLDYIAYLTDRRRFLAGDTFSLADIAAAAQLSVIDYIGDVPWSKHPIAKEWYSRTKSRPAFRAVLAEFIPGFPPSKHYADVDF